MSVKTTPERRTADRLFFKLCLFCRQGGYIRLCALCKVFASCVGRGDLKGCLPERFLYEEQFICPPCYGSTGLAPPVSLSSLIHVFRIDKAAKYSVPSRALASSHAGVNTSPLVVYMVYLDEGPHSRAPPAVIDGQVRGYFHGKVI